MTSRPLSVRNGKPEAPSRVWTFEILDENSDSRANSWPNLGRLYTSLVETARDALGDIYASGARIVLQRKEALEDRRAEHKARNRIAALSVTPTRNTTPQGNKISSLSTSKSRA